MKKYSDWDNAKFICPECGSKKTDISMMVSTNFKPEDVWSSVLKLSVCAGCRYVIPAHLCKRWDNISAEEASFEWRNTFRPTAQKHL